MPEWIKFTFIFIESSLLCCQAFCLMYTLEWVNWPKKLSNPSNSKQNCMENHPKKYLLEIQRFGSPGFGLKLRGQDPHFAHPRVSGQNLFPAHFRPSRVILEHSTIKPKLEFTSKGTISAIKLKNWSTFEVGTVSGTCLNHISEPLSLGEKCLPLPFLTT